MAEQKQKRTDRLIIRLTTQEKQEIQAQAIERGFNSTSAYMLYLHRTKHI